MYGVAAAKVLTFDVTVWCYLHTTATQNVRAYLSSA